MREISVALRQIEKTDLSAIKRLIQSDFSKVADFPAADSFVNSANKFCFAITASKGGTDVYVVGLCGIFNIDWICRTGQLIFAMVDKEKYSATIQNFGPTMSGLMQLIKFGFAELGLNKLWIEILESNHSMETLEAAGFVVEGIRRDASFKKGIFVSSSILSITAQEFASFHEAAK